MVESARPGRPRVGLALALSATVVLAAAAPALAHPALSPSSVNAGTTARVVAAIPNERLGHETVGLMLSFPAGFTVVRVEDTGEWEGSVTGREATWDGGRITGEAVVEFALELRAVAPSDTYDVVLDQRYEDGRSVTTKAPITVLPAVGEAAPDQHIGWAIAAALVGVVLVVGTLVALRLLRRPRPVD